MRGRQGDAGVLSGLLGLGLLTVPAAAVALSGSASSDHVWTALRLAALEGFTLIFVSITLGSLRPLWRHAFNPRTLHHLHVGTGVAGLLLVLSHATMLLVRGLSGYRPGFLWLGPAMLVLLVLAMLAAIKRQGVGRAWRWIHRLNYLVFAVGLVHSFSLGFDLAEAAWLKIWFLVYAAVVACGVIYRLWGLRGRQKR